MYNGNLSKQDNSSEKYSPTKEPGIPLFPPNYTKTRNIRDLLDVPEPKDEMSAIQIQSLRPSKARVKLINTEKSE